jgi:hypothetical protein
MAASLSAFSSRRLGKSTNRFRVFAKFDPARVPDEFEKLSYSFIM